MACGHSWSDGSSTITPDAPALQKASNQPANQKPGCGFPVPKLLAPFDAFTGTVVEMLGFPPYTHELSKVRMLHPSLNAGDRLVGDRGFCSFVHPAMLHARGARGCFRCHQKQIVNFRAGRKNRDASTREDKRPACPPPRPSGGGWARATRSSAGGARSPSRRG